MSRHETIAVYDYDRKKLCDLYDSQNDLFGQAYEISITENDDGTHNLNFKIPYVIDKATQHSSTYGSAIYGMNRYGTSDIGVNNYNFRWEFLRSDYMIRYTCGKEKIWFVADKPQKSKNGKKIFGTVSCAGTECLLKTRSIYKTFDDENGIGTIDYLMSQILTGTGWTYDSTHSDTIYENDGTTEKVRSLQSDAKKGALDLINTVCNLFQARPIYNTDTKVVTIKSIKNRQQVLEGVVGKNLKALNVKHDSSNIATRVYIEGEYGDFGYVGIDDVKVDSYGNPDETGTAWGLPFLLNFDYYRELGVFKQTHETALATYLTDIRAKKAAIRAKGVLLTACEDSINTLIGQCKLAVYYKSSGYITPMYTYGNITSEQAELNEGDSVVIMNDDETFTYDEWPANPATVMGDAYAVIKFATKAAGKIGAAEVQIEAKEKEIARLQRKINTFVQTDPRIEEYEAEIDRLEEEINAIYNGDDDTEGLYQMMSDVVSNNGLLNQLSGLMNDIDQLNAEQDLIEATFISAMGYMLRDGSWSNNNYTIGQEVFLYSDGVDMTRQMSHPATDYSFDYVRVAEDFDVPAEDIEINAIFKLYDPELQIDDQMFITSITRGVDDKSLGKITVSNQDITLTGNDLGSLLSRMSQLADLIEQKNALYERAKALSNDGTLFADRLNGQIDLLKTKLLSTTSNWYTDENGNIVFLSADGTGAMMLSGAGFMLASSKDEDGEWEWRAFGDSHGFTADEIVAGFISAERIEAGSITTDHLSSAVGSELVLTSNTGLTQYVESVANQAASSMRLTDEEFVTMFQNNVAAGINEAIDDVSDDLHDYQSDVSVYMRFDNSGTLELGKSDSNFKTQINNQKMSFLENENEVAYISNQSMYITQARVTDTLSIGTNNGYGYFDWVVTPTGLALKWRDP